MIKLTIDGKQVEARKGDTILNAALDNSLHIPNLCYDRRLRPYGGCRLCLVEVEGQRRLLAACSSPAEDGMVVHTKTPKLKKLRQTVIELLLVHHPLDCPECDKAGECDLQDLAYECGKPEARFIRHRKAAEADVRGPLIELTSRRCILCGKCVRICEEHQGRAALGLIGRGFPTVVQPAFGEILECDYCGQCLDVCPTGAILSKPYKFTARSWFLEEKETICPFCGVGCTIHLGIREGNILRSRGKEGSGINKGNLCGRGRFGIDYIYSDNRLKSPLIREGDEFREISWEDALSYIADNLGSIINEHGPDSVGAVGSPRCTNEDNYTLSKFIKKTIGSGNLDSSAAFGYSGVQSAWKRSFGLGEHRVDIEAPLGRDVILIVESDLSVTHPVLGLNILQAKREGSTLIVADTRGTKLTKHSSLWLKINDGTSVAFINGIINVILENGLYDEAAARSIPGFEELKKATSGYSPSEVARITGVNEDAFISAAKSYARAGKRLLGISVRASENTKGTGTVYAAANLANLLGDGPDSLMIPAEFSNTFGMYEMGVSPELPHGKGVREMLYDEGSTLRGLYVMGEDPATSFPFSARVMERLKSLNFLVVQDIFMTETAKLANVVLPASSWGEKDGTFTNAGGIDQKVHRLVDPAGQSMPDWMIIKNLSLTMEKELGVRNLQDIQREIGEIRNSKEQGDIKREFIPSVHDEGEVPDSEYPFRLVIRDVLQHSGIMSTKSKSLDLVISEALLEINPSDAENNSINENAHVKVTSRQGSVFLKAKISREVPEGTVFVPSHFPFARINTLTRLASNGEQPISAVKIEPAG